MGNALSNLKNAMAQAASKYQDRMGSMPKRAPREWTRQIVKTNMWDDEDWQSLQNDPDVEAAILDLYLGDLKNQEDRPGYENGPELLRDTFMIFLKTAPQLHQKREVKKDARLNGKFIEKIMELDEYLNLHDLTHTDVLAARDAMLLLCDAIKDMIREHREAVKKANEQRQSDDSGEGDSSTGDSWDEETPGSKSSADGQNPPPDGQSGQQDQQQSPGHNENTGKSQFDKDKEEEESEGQDEQDEQSGEQQEQEQKPEDWGDGEEEGKPDDHNTENKDGDDPGEDETQGQSGQGDGEEEEDEQSGGGGDPEDDPEDHVTDDDYEFDGEHKDYDEAEKDERSELEQLIDEVDVGAAMNQALKEAAEEMRAIEEARRGVGIEDGDWALMDPTERKKIADLLRGNKRLREIAELVGKMKRFAQAQQATKIIDSPHEITSIEMGNDLRRVLRSEFAFLGHPTAKYEFYRKFVNGELLMHKERGHETVGKGPIVCCIDNSGSMSGAPENWAKGVAEALRRICQDQGRDFYAIYFGTNPHRERFEFPKGKGSFELVMKFLSMTANWGTEFDGVLEEALQRCQTHFGDLGETKADIVFITDGQAYLSDKWIQGFNEQRKDIGVRLFGVYINAYDSSRNEACGILDKFCDFTLPVNALVIDDDSTAKIFATV